MRFASTFCFLAVLVACKGEPFRPDAKIDAPGDAPYNWWTPEPGETKNWDIQLSNVDLTEPRDMYVLDMWDLVPSPMTITYADSSTVPVPAGSLAGTINMLHARTPRPIIVCHVNTGAIELDDPDAMKFPGYSANPPNRPDPPAAGSVIGWDTGDPNERFLDLREGSRGQFEELIWKRLELAQGIGCDAIEADHNDVFYSTLLEPGFPLSSTPDHVTSWYREVGMQAHVLEISVGMKNGNFLPQGQPQELVDYFDWIMIERCAENTDCDSARPFANKRKAVFAIDYVEDISLALACQEYSMSMVMDGLHKDAELSGAYRMACP